MRTDQHRIDKKGCGERLHDTDDGCFFAGMLQILKPELIADIECNEAERHITDQGEGLNRSRFAVKTEAVSAYNKATEAEGANQDTPDQIGGNIRKMKPLENACHHQPYKQANGDTEKNLCS